MSEGDRLENGWCPDTPAGDSILRRFVLNQVDVNEAYAQAGGGRAERTDDVSLCFSGGPIAYLNQALLLRPIEGDDDPVLRAAESFFTSTDGERTLLSIWPTPDLSARGWHLAGHPAFVLRSPAVDLGPASPEVDVRLVGSAADLEIAERVAIDGYPMPEAACAPAGSILPAGLLDGPVRYFVGSIGDEALGMAAGHVGQGVVNLCLAATLDAGRRRGVWSALVRTRVAMAPDLPSVAFTSDLSRPGFLAMGFLPVCRFTLWYRAG